ncbi:hypothetical protein BGW42_003456 [Actinomortierella wolfii]|nr:hypothetical protein BGW42_003456 [Actinomortierella wolfii]KAG0240862.1 hypothetical protein BGW41_006617 [Actinomortierella wolfii]
MTTLSDEEIAWINEGLDRSPESYFEAFDISDKQRGHLRYFRLIEAAELDHATKKKLSSDFEIWKRNKAPEFWLRRRARIAAMDTATVLVEGSVPYAEVAIIRNAEELRSEQEKRNATETDNVADVAEAAESEIDTSSASGSTSYTVAQPSEPSHSVSLSKEPSAKRRKINGCSDISFLEAPADMNHVHKALYQHAVSLLDQYQRQSDSQKDITLVKDAQVVMSCLLNTMSPRVVHHFTEANDEELISKAVLHATIPGFDQHPCLEVLKQYLPVLEEHDVKFLERKLTKDRGLLLSEYPDDEELPKVAAMRDKVLKILIRLGEKILEASKVLRQQQASEYGEVSDTGRKVDLIFMYEDIELSNIEFKRFVGVIYQVRPMEEISIAGKTTSSLVYLPTTAGELEDFLGGTSLAILWNFVVSGYPS